MRWLTSKDVTARARCDVSTVTRDAAAAQLHGHQRTDRHGRPVPKSRWKFHPDAVDAYIQGAPLAAQMRACGCQPLHAVRGA